MEELTHFLSCDWGTSSFRLKLVELPNLRVVGTAKSDEGNAATFAKWQETKQPEEQRLGFYLNILRGHVGAIEKEFGRPIPGCQS
ncbi:hypothetical protein [Hymenobacter cellulosilyticus]|uniref:Uncharacterized protein n=1 Tax=Hymenobacter cellulosilyticus TaxID=2932248 RepID=A0A8T9Q3I2_9BACT|nr:hypothetical protein [Hymenobacter cellulosilyticus]UOQ70009.1 hypothetical protein MUN79_14550 [Hymenobacter cellulosilyticus]